MPRIKLFFLKESLIDKHSYPDELGKCVVDVSSTRHEETAAGAQIMEEEQLLIL